MSTLTYEQFVKGIETDSFEYEGRLYTDILRHIDGSVYFHRFTKRTLSQQDVSEVYGLLYGEYQADQNELHAQESK